MTSRRLHWAQSPVVQRQVPITSTPSSSRRRHSAIGLGDSSTGLVHPIAQPSTTAAAAAAATTTSAHLSSSPPSSLSEACAFSNGRPSYDDGAVSGLASPPTPLSPAYASPSNTSTPASNRRLSATPGVGLLGAKLREQDNKRAAEPAAVATAVGQHGASHGILKKQGDDAPPPRQPQPSAARRTVSCQGLHARFCEPVKPTRNAGGGQQQQHHQHLSNRATTSGPHRPPERALSDGETYAARGPSAAMLRSGRSDVVYATTTLDASVSGERKRSIMFQDDVGAGAAETRSAELRARAERLQRASRQGEGHVTPLEARHSPALQQKPGHSPGASEYLTAERADPKRRTSKTALTFVEPPPRRGPRRNCSQGTSSESGSAARRRGNDAPWLALAGMSQPCTSEEESAEARRPPTFRSAQGSPPRRGAETTAATTYKRPKAIRLVSPPIVPRLKKSSSQRRGGAAPLAARRPQSQSRTDEGGGHVMRGSPAPEKLTFRQRVSGMRGGAGGSPAPASTASVSPEEAEESEHDAGYDDDDEDEDDDEEGEDEVSLEASTDEDEQSEDEQEGNDDDDEDDKENDEEDDDDDDDDAEKEHLSRSPARGLGLANAQGAGQWPARRSGARPRVAPLQLRDAEERARGEDAGDDTVALFETDEEQLPHLTSLSSDEVTTPGAAESQHLWLASVRRADTRSPPTASHSAASSWGETRRPPLQRKNFLRDYLTSPGRSPGPVRSASSSVAGGVASPTSSSSQRNSPFHNHHALHVVEGHHGGAGQSAAAATTTTTTMTVDSPQGPLTPSRSPLGSPLAWSRGSTMLHPPSSWLGASVTPAHPSEASPATHATTHGEVVDRRRSIATSDASLQRPKRSFSEGRTHGTLRSPPPLLSESYATHEVGGVDRRTHHTGPGHGEGYGQAHGQGEGEGRRFSVPKMASFEALRRLHARLEQVDAAQQQQAQRAQQQQ